MIGLGTNTLLRLLVKDDEQQLRKLMAALESISDVEPVVVNVVVVQEAVWVMTKVLGFSKSRVVTLLQDLLDQDDLLVVPKSAVRQAVQGWAAGKAEFADYLIGELNAQSGCRTTLTFDTKPAQHPTFTRVV